MIRRRLALPLLLCACVLACAGCLPFWQDNAGPASSPTRAGAATTTLAPRATQTTSPIGRPTDTPTEQAPAATPRITLRTFIHPILGFSFQYPPSWSLEQAVGADMRAQGGRHYADSITLRRGELLLSIAYRAEGQARALDTSMPAGTLAGRGAIRFLGRMLPRTALVWEGKDKAIYYYAERDGPAGVGIVFQTAFTSANANYLAASLAPEAQVEVDAILSSFALPAAPQAVGEVAEGWAGQALVIAGAGAEQALFARNGLDPARYPLRADDAISLAQWGALADLSALLRVWGRVEPDPASPGGVALRLTRWELAEGATMPESVVLTGRIEQASPGAAWPAWLVATDGGRTALYTPSSALARSLSEAAWRGASARLTGALGEVGGAFVVRAIELLDGQAAGVARDLSPFATPSASSQLPSDRLGSYTPWDALDGRPATAWAEGAAGTGQGEWLALTLPGPAALEAVEIQAGYAASKALFAANNRPRTVHVMLDDGVPMEFVLADTSEPQNLALDGVVATSVRVFLGQSYPGSRFDDTCLSEIRILGTPLPN